VRGATIVKGHEITWPPPAPKLTAAPVTKATAKVESKPAVKPAPAKSTAGPIIAAVIGVAALFGVGAVAPPDFLAHFTVFVLACFVGYMVVWNVTPALHTPLMSVTNAISSIIIIGAVLQISSTSPLVSWMAAVTVAVTSVNIAGGFAVTRRMLEMFRK
jgi:NAD(P) transhydrogenase subunit alpha